MMKLLKPNNSQNRYKNGYKYNFFAEKISSEGSTVLIEALFSNSAIFCGFCDKPFFHIK